MKYCLLLILSLGISNLVVAQEKSDFSVSFNHMAFAVKDVVISAEFYKKTLNLQPVENKTKKEGRRWFSLGDGKELHLILNEGDEISTHKAVHLAVTTDNFEAFISKLRSMKIPFTNWPGIANKVQIRADGIQQIYFQDPDGYWIEVNSVADKQ